MKIQRWSLISLVALLFCTAAISSTPAGEKESNLESCVEAIRVNPDDASAYCDLGAAYYDVGSYKEAVETYKKAVRLKPNFASARLQLGMAYLKLGDTRSAKDEYKKLRDIDKEMAKKLKKLVKSSEENKKETEKARKKAEKEAEKAKIKAAKEIRKQERERLKKKAKILGISVREVQEREFWENFWERYRHADPGTQQLLRYQMEVYLKNREVEAQEEMARASREAADAMWWNRSRPYGYDPYYYW